MEVDLSDERFGRDVPFEMFAALQRSSPVHWYEPGQYWAVTTHALVEQVNRDFGRFSSARGPMPPDDPAFAQLPVMISDDPPVHTAYRRKVGRSWTPRAVAEWEPLVREVTRQVVAEFREKGGGDFVADVAAPIPFRIMARLVGIPESDGPQLVAWINARMPSEDPEYRGEPDGPARASAAISEYYGELLARRRAEPRDDLASALLELDLDERERRSLLSQYVSGGSETSRHVLSHAVVALAAFPDERRRLVEGAVGMDTAVEELVRWGTPVLHHSRWATVDIELGGADVSAGDRLTLWMIAANFDDTVFRDPHRLDLGRTPNPHTSFGAGGPHFCLGAPLARMEIAIVLDELRPVLDRLEPAGPAERVWSSFFNGIKRLPVRIG